VALIEDAAHAVGATWRGRACGSIGRVGCFSFFSNKNLPVGEGGMIVTDDEDAARRVRLLRSHGMTTPTWTRHRGHAAAYDVLDAGFNYRLDEVRAAIGLVQLERLAERNQARRRIVHEYRALLDGVDGIALPFAEAASAEAAHHLAVALLPAGTPRDDVRAQLRAMGVQTSVHYPPIHRFIYYRARAGRDLSRTDAVAERLLTLPLYPHLTDEDVQFVAGAVRAALRN
jgi:dTDP-4-amino-4,6-dideoxygalactose transaminase